MKEKLKKILYSSRFPFGLFAIYFKLKEKGNKEKLFQLLGQKTDLLEAVNESQRAHWEKRIQKVLDAPENKNIIKSRRCRHS